MPQILSAGSRAIAALSIALPLAFHTPAFADFRTGLSAFNRGEYELAVAQWSAAARTGDVKAQSGLAYLYFKGMGVPQDRAIAAELYQKAATSGQPEAQMFLGAIYLYGEGLPQDFIKAFVWCEIAQGNGAVEALECRDMAMRKMTQAQVDLANGLISKWYREHK